MNSQDNKTETNVNILKTKLNSQILDDQFSIINTSGGVLGILASILPTFIFVFSYLAFKQVLLPIILAILSSVILGIISLYYKKTLSQVLFGLLGVIICSLWVYKTGHAENFFALGLWTNLIYMLVLLLSIIIRYPLFGIIIEAVFSEPLAWKKSPIKYKKYTIVTWVWIGMFALRLLIKTPLYFTNNLPWLATAHIILSVPLYVLVVYTSWIILKPILRKNNKKDE